METEKLYNTDRGILVQAESDWFRLEDVSWDDVFRLPDPGDSLAKSIRGRGVLSLRPENSPDAARILAPLASQEIWAAGVTYYRSRDARMEESEKAGGGSFYDRVYNADRPELFFKGSSRTVAAPGSKVRIRKDSKWNVPEPELTLALNDRGRIIGYTIGNDMSSRDIEGENPLYLPQAKVYDGSAAIGPCVLLTGVLPPETEIRMKIERDGGEIFRGTTVIGQIKRSFSSLAQYLFRDNTFPSGCYLMTGTGIVPPNQFTLQPGDTITITIPPVGTLINAVA